MSTDLFDFGQIGTEDLNADGRANAGGKHIDAILNWHCPGVRHTGEANLLVHLFD